MSSYKAYVVEKPKGGFQEKEVEKPTPKDGEILVKVLACGVCASDELVTNGAVPLPRIPGHEIIGSVEAVPASEKRFKKGDRVGSGWCGGWCNECSECQHGRFVTCEHSIETYVNGVSRDGGYSEYVLLRREAVASMPTDQDPALLAPLLCAGVTVFNSLRNQDLQAGDTVAICGIGGLGHLAIQYAAAMGFTVVALSTSDNKKQFATDLGAHYFFSGSVTDQVKQLKEIGGVKCVVATAPHPDAVIPLMEAMQVNGTLLTLAIMPEMKLGNMTMVTKRLRIQGWPSGGPRDSEDCVEFAIRHGIKTIIQKYDAHKLEEVKKAYDSMESGKVRFRSVLVF